jgi:hypothetical protein
MRYLSALIVGVGLSLPSISQAATPERGPQVAQSAVQAPAAAPRANKPSVSSTPAPRTMSATDDKARYAAREAASPEAQAYRGGDTIVIGATAATAILAVILLIVLL